ncbi:MAG: helix-turn-helix transcriptional regulator [Sulfurovum sp.]|nr:helix-turn-helix transcriptional regulator [Sulfurovum sp.]
MQKINHTLEIIRHHLDIKNKKEFAEKIGITPNTYTNYIKDEREIPTTLAIKIDKNYII